jgi:beta-1,2-mannobiose phosphorylase / 1,2-beta-oligomannan phosphorylase
MSSPDRLSSCYRFRNCLSWALVASTLSGLSAAPAIAQVAAAKSAEFPRALVDFVPGPHNPVFQAEGPGHWDVKLRERGWILKEGDTYHLWFTADNNTRDATRMLGYATSPDGLHWTRYPNNPLDGVHWIEDVTVIKDGDTYVMFAEGLRDRAQLLTSKDRIHWERHGALDIRRKDGKPISDGPYGTPTAWLEDGVWHLFYERGDIGVWLATSKDLKVWTNVQDEPVLLPGPELYDKDMIAMNQIVKYEGAYYAYYHGSPGALNRTWNTNVARSTDLVHWVKYPGNPLVADNKSSGILVFDGTQYRLYTMHDGVDVYFPRGK